MAKFRSKKNFSSGRDENGNLYQFIEGGIYDKVKIPSKNWPKIKHLFEEVEDKKQEKVKGGKK